MIDPELPWVLVIVAVMTILALLLRGSPLLSLSPRMYSGPNWLIARTSFPTLLLFLFCCQRKVTVDQCRRTIKMHRRFLWLFRHKTDVLFDDVEKILYFLDDLNPTTMLGYTGDTFDRFKVQLRLQDGTDLHLFSFVGVGTFQRGWDTWWFIPDWFFTIERISDMSGAQAIQSREFLDRLQSLLNVPIGRTAT